jgi:hypothetical protein
MMMNRLLTPWEVVKYGPVQGNYPTEYLDAHLNRIEESLFDNSYLGIEYYNSLVADLVDLSSAVVYNMNDTYAENDLVVFDQMVFISLIDNNDDAIQDSEDLNPSWGLPTKFTTPQNEVLWNKYLKYWLSFSAIHNTIRYTTYQAGAQGLMTISDDATGASTVGHKDFVDFKRETKDDADDLLQLMLKFMVRTTMDSTYDFSAITDVCIACGSNSTTSALSRKIKKRGRRIYLKR